MFWDIVWQLLGQGETADALVYGMGDLWFALVDVFFGLFPQLSEIGYLLNDLGEFLFC